MSGYQIWESTMKFKDARGRIDRGESASSLMQEFIRTRISSINFETSKHGRVRRAAEESFAKKSAEIDFCYYVFWKNGEKKEFEYDGVKYDMLDFEKFTEVCNIIYDDMTISLHDMLKPEEIDSNDMEVYNTAKANNAKRGR